MAGVQVAHPFVPFAHSFLHSLDNHSLSNPALDDLRSSKYDLRPGARLFRDIIFTTWLDQDQSGDFDPTGKEPEPPFSLTRKRERLTFQLGDNQTGDSDSTPKKPKLNTWKAGRNRGLSCPITIKFESDGGRALLQKYDDISDNWPEYRYASGDRGPNFTELNLDSVQPQRLRARQQNQCTITSSTSQSDFCCDHPAITELTLGHPAARGCKGCFEVGAPCTLLQEGFSYPCFACQEDDLECELILPPAKKRPCESCRRRRIVCSYRSDDDHSSPCKQCVNDRMKCVAGPLSGRTRTGPSLDGGHATAAKFIPGAERRYGSCTECRKVKKWCSLASKLSSTDNSTCNRCVGLTQKCTFEAVDTRQKRAVDIQNKTTPQPASKPDPLEINGATGTTSTITTRLVHPITFNHLVSDDGSSPCHWCEDIVYGIVGFTEVHVEVIDYHDGQGYVEIKGGHTAQGQEPSRMCYECTASRLFIAGCEGHDIQPIAGVDPNGFNYDEVLEWLVPGMTLFAPFQWCSVCPSPASFACKKPRISGMCLESEENAGGGPLGCGLLLCENCAVNMLGGHDGGLDGLISELEHAGPLCIRADADFLRSDGYLLRRIYGC
ncbi:MAG: hypothetical protein Q9187_006226 [Circinaria calcarea]